MFRTTLVKRMIWVTALFSVSELALANYVCQGSVYGVVVAPNGVVSTESLGSMNWSYWCNVTETANGVNPETCRAIVALLLTAQAQGKQVRVWFNDTQSCTTRPPWQYQTGWYYGPEIL